MPQEVEKEIGVGTKENRIIIRRGKGRVGVVERLVRSGAGAGAVDARKVEVGESIIRSQGVTLLGCNDSRLA